MLDRSLDAVVRSAGRGSIVVLLSDLLDLPELAASRVATSVESNPWFTSFDFSRRRRKKTFERIGPEPVPTIDDPRITCSSMKARIQCAA